MGHLVLRQDSHSGFYKITLNNLPLWSFSVIMNQIILIEHNMVNNPNWLEANQLAILQVWQRI